MLLWLFSSFFLSDRLGKLRFCVCRKPYNIQREQITNDFTEIQKSISTHVRVWQFEWPSGVRAWEGTWSARAPALSPDSSLADYSFESAIKNMIIEDHL